ncbi:hypothetical protein ABFS82_14G314100 [Erythranthe guttata]|uniref:C2 domain-containing protein n=1 Tax=Erythranthe guttata TaxID=4155 RepID=A0A022Q5G8_ERYGU|nr:PREDICTED: uncharacterized protein LOC105972854 [Erythranthe guttata]EYU23912.1 hypothetical protein MIMGU_mgv1a014817mg [Erythranthe guttata]|eukprot:XP_012853290.1 PREDICTED: uncharacterized protein LOC105972854 [Erythranthe guttata]
MDCRNLEITVVSAKDLEDVRVFFGKTAVHARVSISGKAATATERRTPTDRHGNKNPAWNFTTSYTVTEAMVQGSSRMLVVKLYCDSNAGDIYIGEVHISLRELFESATVNSQAGLNEKGGSVGGGGPRSAVMISPVMKGGVQSLGSLTIAYSFGEMVTIDNVLMSETIAPLLLQRRL